MKFKSIMGAVFPVFDSAKRKQNVFKKIISSEQKNEGVINIHRHDPTNVGDFYCAPHTYFKELKGTALDISGVKRISYKARRNWAFSVSNNSLIIGGGGLLNLRHFEKQMKLFEGLKSKGKKQCCGVLGIMI